MSLENPHQCGACGYDGGLEHAKEVGRLNEQIARYEEDNRAPGESKLLFTAVVFFFICLFGWMSWDSYIRPPDNVVNKHFTTSPLEEIAESNESVYRKCIDNARSQEERHECNNMYSDLIKSTFDLVKENSISNNDMENNQQD